MTAGHVPTPYGELPGCPECGVIAICGTHICEHGVTPPATVDVLLEATITVEDRALYDRLTGTTDA